MVFDLQTVLWSDHGLPSWNRRVGSRNSRPPDLKLSLVGRFGHCSILALVSFQLANQWDPLGFKHFLISFCHQRRKFQTPPRPSYNISSFPPRHPSAYSFAMGFVDFLTDAGLASKLFPAMMRSDLLIAILTGPFTDVTQRSTAG